VKSVVVGTAGHIDHGKSALVRALTGTDPDRLKEEKARGITIDLGFAHLQIGSLNLAFVDVPGHERFVRNMLAGAGGIDMVVLVIAADESVMPQTREHFQICRLLRVPAGLMVLTKSDLADQDMQALAQLEARELVKGSFLEDAPIVPVSSSTGAGFDDLRRELVRIAESVRARDDRGPVRLAVDRVFSVKGFGTVVTGTLVSGVVSAGDDLLVLPQERLVKVRGLQVHGRAETSAAAGRRVAVNVAGAEVEDISRGDTLCTPGAFESTRRFDALLNVIEGAPTVKHGARVRFHHGTSEVLGRVAVAGPASGHGPAGDVPAGGSAFVRIRLESPAVLTRGDRFIIRSYSPAVTVAGGVVLDPAPQRAAIRTPAGRERLLHLGGEGRAGTDEAVRVFLAERGIAGVPRPSLISRAGLLPFEADALIARYTAEGMAAAIGDLLVSTAALEQATSRLLAAIDAHHSAEPLSDGLSREEARERVFGRADPAVFERTLATLVGSGTIVARDRLARSGRQLSLTAEETRVLNAIEQTYRVAGLAPPDLAAAAREAGADAAVAERVTKLLQRQKKLVRLDTLLFHADVLDRLKSEVRATRGAAGTASSRVDVAAFKERYGISRKYAIPLLEYLDRERVTRRVGDARVVI
jgi:selenocysteine-specific elongation factor